MRIAGLSILDLPRLLMGGMPRESSGAAVRQWCGAWRGAGVVLVLLCLAVYLPGLASIPPVDRDESRFAQASRQMYESGDFVVPRIQDRPRLNKPPLIYWVQCGSIAVFGDRPGQYANANIWVFRLPSVLCAIGTVLITWRLGVRMFDARVGVVGAALLAVSPMIVWDAHQARADQLLLMTTTATMLGLWGVWSGSRRERGRTGGWKTWGHPGAGGALLWGALALGVLAKGPITPMVAGLTVLALCVVTRRWRWAFGVGTLAGLVMVLAIVGPWVYAVGERVGWSEYLREIYEETLGRSKDAKEGHWGPPGYHVVLLVVLFWPGVLLTAAAVGRAIRKVRKPSPARLRSGFVERPELFLLAWIVPSWVVFEVIATKLPHYTLPMYPAVALLSARMVLAATGAAKRRVGPGLMFDLGFWVWCGIGCVLCAAGAGGLALVAMGRFAGAFDWLPGKFGFGVAALVVLMAATVIGFAWHVIRLGRQGNALGLIAPSVGVVVIVWLAIRAAAPAAIDASPRIAEAFLKLDPKRERAWGSVLYHEDSLLFTTRGKVMRINSTPREIDVGAIDAWFAAHPDGIVVIPEKSYAYLEEYETLKASLVEVDRGFHAVNVLATAGPNWYAFYTRAGEKEGKNAGETEGGGRRSE